MFKRISFFGYGVICYLIFFATFTYALGFIGNILVPKSLDSLPQLPVLHALIINCGLLLLFAVQHSVMARKRFKEWWTTIVPEPIERSTYVLFSSLALIVLLVYWQPMGGYLWQTDNVVLVSALNALYVAGFGLLFTSTLWIDHFHLFGLRQVYDYLRGQETVAESFKTPSLYQHVRHPLYLGWIIGAWSTPNMSVAHFVFALMTTLYILVGVRFEERDLQEQFGEAYAEYRQKVPMLIPFSKRVFSKSDSVPAAAKPKASSH